MPEASSVHGVLLNAVLMKTEALHAEQMISIISLKVSGCAVWKAVVQLVQLTAYSEVDSPIDNKRSGGHICAA